MSGLELNKILAAILLAMLIGMVAGNFADVFYHVGKMPEKRGYSVAVTEAPLVASADAKPIVFLVGQLMAKADAALGEAQVKKCTTCHGFEKGGSNKLGPNLWGVVNRPIGSHEGFAYSDAMKNHGGKWDYDSLFHFLHKPKDFIKGTKMAFVGFSNETDIANVVAYLRKQADKEEPLPPVEADKPQEPAPTPTPAPATPAAAPATPASPSGDKVKEEKK